MYLAKVISILPETTNEEEETESDEDFVQVTLGWMIRKLCREVKKEVAEQPSASQKVGWIFIFFNIMKPLLSKYMGVSVIKIELN